MRETPSSMQPMLAELSSTFTPDEVDEIVLAERVRSHLGRVCSHPGAIEVHLAGGAVTLEGDVLASEHAPLLACARTVRGVTDVKDGLRVHPSAAGIPALQGGRARGEIPELFQENWAPSIRVLVGGLGLGLIGYGLACRTALGTVLGTFGLAALLRTLR